MTEPEVTQPLIARTREELARALEFAGVRTRAVVMTMGALHDGHAQLIGAARKKAGPDGHVTVTIFVNPLQFAAGEDLDKYPRTFESDVAVCAAMGADLIFAPGPDVMYPEGNPAITIDPGPLGDLYEGASRDDHFRGVLTVVAKLLALTKPQYALFGEKDYQQLTLIRQMAHDLDVDTEIVGFPIVRAEDGLALSSRNKYLSAQDRATALAIPAAVEAAQRAAAAGSAAAMAAALSTLAAAPGLSLDYVAITDPLMRAAPEQGEGRVIITAIVGGTRLLDNARLDLGTPRDVGGAA